MFTAFTLLLKISMHVQVIYFLIFLIFWKAFWTEICFIDFGSPKKWKKNDWKVIHCFLFAFVYKVAENVFWAIRALFVVPSSLLFHLTCFLSCIVYKFLILYFLIFFLIFNPKKNKVEGSSQGAKNVSKNDLKKKWIF